MMKVNYKNWEWKEIGELEISSDIFDAQLRKDLIARVIRWQLAKARSGNHSTKTLSDVSGTTRKPWAQKETGRARQGSLRAPHFRGGGVVFGPHPRSHGHQLNKKLRRFASISTLSNKLLENQLHVLENFEAPFEKTARMVDWIKEREMKSVLFVYDNTNKDFDLEKLVSNIPYCDVLPVCGLNVYDMVKHKDIICDVNSLKCIEERYAKKELQVVS